MARWRSRAVTLVLLGAGMTACAPAPQSQQYRRNIYASREDCYRDYSPTYCEPYGARYYFGPQFWVSGGARPTGDPGPGANARPGQLSTLAADITPPYGVTAPTRGGIGATARGYGGGYPGGG